MHYTDIIDYLKFSKRIFIKRGLPIQLIYFVTNKCNSKCKHCFLKDRLNKEENILKLDEIEKVSSTIPLLASVSLTGGEPFLRPDLPEIAEIFYKNSRVKNIVVTTNGYFTEDIFSAVNKICKKCKEARIFLGVSLDGIGESHNILRGLSDSFRNAVNTFHTLKKLKRAFKNLNIGVSITFSPYNQDEIIQLYQYVRDRMCPDNIGINFMRGNNWKDGNVNDINIEKYKNVTSLKRNDYIQGRINYNNSPLIGNLAITKEFLQYRLIEKIYNYKEPANNCYAGLLLAVMSSIGDIYPCEMLSEKIGNVRDFDYKFDKLWFSKLADELRKFISKKKCFCTYECAITTSILFNPRYYITILREFFKI